MTIPELAEIQPQTLNGFVHFGVTHAAHQGPPNSSPLDIFSGRFSDGVWLETVDDAETLAALIRMAIKIAFAMDPHDPLAAMRLIPNLIGPDAFGGPANLQTLNQWLTNCQTQPPAV
mgnify:CR=1 FL=1